MIPTDPSVTTDTGVGRLLATLSAWPFCNLLLLQDKETIDVEDRCTTISKIKDQMIDKSYVQVVKFTALKN